MEWFDSDYVDISELRDKILVDIKVHDDAITFTTSTGDVYDMYHSQDCCESVCIDDIVGNVTDLIGRPILIAEEVEGVTPADFEADHHESYTWTFYKLATIKGYVDIRWFGSSNGYYSESVDFRKRK